MFKKHNLSIKLQRNHHDNNSKGTWHECSQNLVIVTNKVSEHHHHHHKQHWWADFICSWQWAEISTQQSAQNSKQAQSEYTEKGLETQHFLSLAWWGPSWPPWKHMSTIINAYTVNAQNSQVDAVLAIYQDRMYSIDECLLHRLGKSI
jgi:hypothetical protein